MVKEVLTNDVIESIRKENQEEMRQYSVYAACLLPIVHALEGSIDRRKIAESLPHYSFLFDLETLISVLAILGHKSEKTRKNVKSLEPHELPCIYIDKRDDLYILKDKQDDDFIYFSANSNDDLCGPIEGNGDVYQFLAEDADVNQRKVQKQWFSNIISRFRPLINRLLFISFILNVTALSVPLFVMTIYDYVVSKKNIDVLPMLAVGIVIVLATDILMRMLRARVLAIPAGRMEYLLSTESLKQILSLPSAMTERTPVTVQLSKLRLYDSIRDFFTGETALLVLEAPFIPIFVVTIAILGGNIVLIPLATLVIFLLLGFFTIPRLKVLISESAESRTEHEQLLLETLAGITEIKAMAEERGWMQRIRESSRKNLKATLNASQSQAVLACVAQSIVMLSVVGVIAVGGYKATVSEITIGGLIAIMAILWRVIGPIQSLFLAYIQFDQIRRGVAGLNDLMALKCERTASKASMLKQDFDGDIKFERVSFRYNIHLDPVLIGANFHIKAKQFSVIVGENGSGKSTILKLLCGMYYAQAGNIFIDDTEIRQLNVTELRRIVGYVPQHPRLFHGDIAHNLRLSDLLATDEDLHIAAEEAGILHEIEKLPKGFSTRLGDKATDGLPNGFQRSLCVARAFVRKSPVLILDEPGAAQDKTNLQHLINQLKIIKGKKTIIIVSHSPEIISLADQVVVMDKGSVGAIATPEQYLATQDRALVL